MSVYDYLGNIACNDTNRDYAQEPEFLSSSIHNRLKKNGDGFDVTDFDLIREFTAFPVSYATNTNTPRVLDISSDTFLDTFYNSYLGVGKNNALFTKKKLQLDESGTYNVWAYDLMPVTPKRKVLLTSGMHTYELPASFGLARWVKELLTSDDEVFEYLRTNVQFGFIPIINPWGFNQNPKKYGNVHGVNPARNFDDWTGYWETYPVYTPDQNEWNVKGSAPFSESETKIFCNWMRHNIDANFHIDCHTGLGCSRSDNGDVWIYYASDHPIINGITSGRDALLSYISNKYHTTATVKESIDHPDVTNHRYFNTVIGVPTMTIEQPQGSDTLWTTVPNNSDIAIQEYATHIHAFVMAQLKENV